MPHLIIEDSKNNTDLPSVIVAPAANLRLPLFQSFLFGIRRNNEYFLVESKGPFYTDLEHPVASLDLGAPNLASIDLDLLPGLEFRCKPVFDVAVQLEHE